MLESKGYEICAEWLYHLGIPQDKINEMVTKELLN